MAKGNSYLREILMSGVLMTVVSAASIRGSAWAWLLLMGLTLTPARLLAQEPDRVKAELFREADAAMQRAQQAEVPFLAPAMYTKAETRNGITCDPSKLAVGQLVDRAPAVGHHRSRHVELHGRQDPVRTLIRAGREITCEFFPQ